MFPYIHIDGGICCSSPISACNRCRAKMLTDDPAAARLAAKHDPPPKPAWAMALLEGVELRVGIHYPGEHTMKNRYAPIDPYGPALKARALHEKQSPAEQLAAFEASLTASRLAELDAELDRHEMAITDNPWPRLTAEQLAAYIPIDPWEQGIRALREKERR